MNAKVTNMSDIKIEIVPLNKDAPESIQFVFGYRVWFMGCWRVCHSTFEEEIKPLLARKIGAA